MSEKIYCGNARIQPTQYGDMMKISLSREDINKIVKFAKDEEREWVNIEVKEKRNKEEGKPTHYLEVDQWKPTQQAQAPVEAQPELANGLPDENSDLPF